MTTAVFDLDCSFVIGASTTVSSASVDVSVACDHYYHSNSGEEVKEVVWSGN